MNILVVDDSRADRETFKRMLAASPLAPLRTQESALGESALVLCRQEPPDCILLDFRLPDMDGLEFLSVLRDDAGDPLVPVVMLTGEGSESIAVEALRLGAQDYLVKSILGPEALTWAIVGARTRFALLRRNLRQHEELRHFAHSAAHDLKAPLRKVESFAGILTRCARPESPGDARAVAGLNRSLAQMRAMIEGLLGFARSGAGLNREEDVDLNEVLRTALFHLDEEHDPKRANVSIEPLACVRGEAPGLVQVFQNLLANALKFNRSASPSIQVRGERRADEYVVSVTDDGIGIDPAHAESIFQPFRRLNGCAEFPGSGLGLATCRRIVEHHGGTISCVSELGRGTTVRMTLRAAGPDPSVRAR
jgi:signal transduction histidine kinase